MLEKTARLLALILITAGILLHVYIALFTINAETTMFSLGLLAWSGLPYLICAFVARNHSLVALGGVTAVFLIDLYVYYTAVAPSEITAPVLELLFAPFWNLILYMPIGMLIGRWISRKSVKSTDTAG